MGSGCTRRFWQLYSALPREIQKLADKQYHLWRQNHRHPSLHFKKLRDSERFSVRVGDHYRALGYVAEDAVVRVWIGTHAEYDKLVGRSEASEVTLRLLCSSANLLQHC